MYQKNKAKFLELLRNVNWELVCLYSDANLLYTVNLLVIRNYSRLQSYLEVKLKKKMDSGYKFSKSHELMLPLLLMSSPTVESYLFTPLQIFGRLFKECLLIINLFTALLFILDLNIHYLCFHNFFTELLFWLNIPL